MCYICNSSPHLAICPFYSAVPKRKCSVCDGEIFETEVSYKLKNHFFHSDCLRELNGIDVIEELEIKPI